MFHKYQRFCELTNLLSQMDYRKLESSIQYMAEFCTSKVSVFSLGIVDIENGKTIGSVNIRM